MQYAFRIFENVIVPESNDAIAAAFKLRGSVSVIGHSHSVLTAINLDDQLLFNADEVRDVSANPYLPAKFVTVEPAMAKFMPKPSLGIRH